VEIPREDLERLTSAATAFVALQRMRAALGGPAGGATVRVDGVEQPLNVEQEIEQLQEAVIRTRRMLGWRQ